VKALINHNQFSSKNILKNIGIGLCLLDRNLHILWVNSVHKEWFDDKNGDTRGKSCYKTFQHKTHPCRGCPTLKVFKTGRIERAVRSAISQNGKRRYYQLIVSPIKDKQNKVVQALELVEDITDKLIQEKEKNNIIYKLKKSLEHLLSANRRIHKETNKLKKINKLIAKLKDRIYKKYRYEISELKLAEEELQGILKINTAFGLNSDLKKISNLISMLTCRIMHTEACIIRLFDEKRGILHIEGGWGLRKNHLSLTPLKLGESISGRVAKIGRPVVVDDLCKEDIAKCPEIAKKEGLVSVVAMPMVCKDKLVGVISTYSRRPRHFTEEEIKPLSVFASQAAVAVQEARLCEDVHITYFNIIHSLMLAMEARDPYTRGHADRVTSYSIEIAQEMGLSENEIEILRYAGEVHDVGKIAISDLILNKPGKLTPTEQAIIEVHPVRGAEMLEPLQFLRPAIPMVKHHHERYDGKGYPDGLDKERIPLMARIMACADAFDAMTSDRPYRKCRMTIKEALLEIKENIGTQFDPKVARAFIRIIRKLQ